ncbi:MAG: SRPBCC family protein [Gemmatimonadaceae bacterium]|nr:SRPBCC family protein [Gemmatimonadaceae bacterium]
MKKLIILIVLVAGGLWLYGRKLPADLETRSSVTLVARADTVFQTIRKIGNNPLWWSELKSVRQVPGRRRETWEQNMGGGIGLVTIEITQLVDGQIMTTQTTGAEEDGETGPDWTGSWNFRVTNTAAGTRVTMTETLHIEPPFLRIWMKVRGRYRTVDTYLTSLAGQFGEIATPQHGDR